jgi:uncharacterized DUF497 family protein
MTDDDFEALLGKYLETTNPEMVGVEIEFNEGNGDTYGADHAAISHGVTKEQISEVLFELEAPEEKRSSDAPERTIFWGHTRRGESLCVVCLDERSSTPPRLGLITAFPETEEQWRRRQ